MSQTMQPVYDANGTDGPDPLPPGAPGTTDTDDGPLDDIGSGIKAFFDIGLSIGTKLDDVSDKLDRYMRRLQRSTPVRQTIPGSVIIPTVTAPSIIPFGAPDEGTAWDVRGCVVGGTEVNLAAVGTAGLYVGAFQAVAGSGMTNLHDYASSFPNVAQYGGGQILVNSGEFVWLVVFGGTAGQQYAGNLSVDVLNVGVLGNVVEAV